MTLHTKVLLFALPAACFAMLGCGSSSPSTPSQPRCNTSITASLHPAGTAGLAALTTYTFTASGTCSTYSWNFGDGTAGNGASVSHMFETPGQFTVSLTGAMAGGATETTTQITVVKSMSGVFAGTCNATPPMTFALTLAQSGHDVSFVEYTDSRGERITTPAAFLFFENWDHSHFAFQLILRDRPSALSYFGSMETDLNSFFGHCNVLDVAYISMTGTRR